MSGGPRSAARARPDRPRPDRPGNRRRAPGRGRDRFAGQDLDQGSAGPGARDGRGDRRSVRELQQRGRSAAHRRPARGGHPIPGGRDGGPRRRAHRLPVRDRTAAGRNRAQRRHGPPRRVRLGRRHRRRQGGAGRGPARDRGGGPQRRRSRGPGRCGPGPGADRGLQRERPACGRGRHLGRRRQAGAEGCCAFRVCSSDRSEPEVEVQLRVSGRHQVGNALAAVAAARALGLGLEQIAGALSWAQPRSRWRMEMRRRSSGGLVINDAYNANPESMRAALDTLVDIARAAGGAPHLGRTRRHAGTRFGRGRPSTGRWVTTSPTGVSIDWSSSGSSPAR